LKCEITYKSKRIINHSVGFGFKFTCFARIVKLCETG